MKKLCVIYLVVIFLGSSCTSPIHIKTEQLKLVWEETDEGWQVAELATKNETGEWLPHGKPSGEYSFLYSVDKPTTKNDRVFKNNQGKEFPGAEFKYIINNWKGSVNPVTLNQVGEIVQFYPTKLEEKAEGLVFEEETKEAHIKAVWRSNSDNPNDVLLTLTLTARKSGWFSLVSPTLATLDAEKIGWGAVPGSFQGKALRKDTVSALGYAQGLPNIPFIAQDRTVTTPMSILENDASTALSVILTPGQTRALISTDGKITQKRSRTGFSHMNRAGQLTPMVYVPLLSHPDAELQVGEQIETEFRYRLSPEGWFPSLQYAMDEVYDLSETLALKKQKKSLSQRIAELLDYSLDDKTSFWKEMSFEGKPLGAQMYMSGVVGSQQDATKNSDIGAMWMMAAMTENTELKQRRLPLVRNFKMFQQETDSGFFQGAARGQYFLFKSEKWVEEWGSHIEPVGVTYYTLADLGNILLFQPEDKELMKAFKQGAERLLQWQQPDGSWVVGYDHKTGQPVYTDLKDYRPTFYGLLIAYRILGEEKYLSGAIKGADWILENSVDNGFFLGVCGDVRFTNDFATAQIAQALLDLGEITGDEKYKKAGIATAKMYVTSIYSHPKADTSVHTVKDKKLQGWEYTQSGLGFEHGGNNGSAVHFGPILLASHAGMFVRLAKETGNAYFAELARAAAWGRDAHVNPETSVASYYWRQMDRGAGSFPHHAWWQIGWLMDYLVSEAAYRSNGQIQFPAGFMTAKVGPHKPYGFENGVICEDSAKLFFQPEIIKRLSPSTDLLMAKSTSSNNFYLIFIQNDTDSTPLSLELKTTDLLGDGAAAYSIWDAQQGSFTEKVPLDKKLELPIEGKGIQIVKVEK